MHRSTGERVTIGGAITATIAAAALAVFSLAVGETFEVEGGFVNHPDDPGGATNMGITEAVARRHGYAGPMHDLTREDAKAIYLRDYWNAQRLSAISETYPELARQLFDVGVNAGIGRSGRWLQRCLSVLNGKARYYPDLVVDGVIGPSTLAALRAYHRRRGDRGEGALMTCVGGLQAHHYVRLAERSERFETFAYGWLLRVRSKSEE